MITIENRDDYITMTRLLRKSRTDKHPHGRDSPSRNGLMAVCRKRPPDTDETGQKGKLCIIQICNP